ncbi:MAG: hypothetical protein WDO16_03800 [Bacteroidota bacterium]
MKQKTIYIILIVCCLSLFSSAKQMGKEECVKKSCCKINELKAARERDAKKQAEKTYDLSPLQLFMFNI